MEYSSEELKQITAIIEKNGKLKDVANFMKVSAKIIRKDIKENLELKTAFSKGKKARDYLEYDLIKRQLPKIEEVAEKTGQKTLVAQFLNTDLGKLRRTERVYPDLALVVRRGLDKYKSNQRAAKLANKKSPDTAGQKQSKPKRELVARLNTIEDISEENALARYRRMKEEEKKASIHKQVKNISEII